MQAVYTAFTYFALFRSAAEVTTFGHQSSLSKIANLCEELKNQLLSTQKNGAVDPRLEIPTDTRDTLVTWLLGDPRVSYSHETFHRVNDACKFMCTSRKNDVLKEIYLECQHAFNLHGMLYFLIKLKSYFHSCLLCTYNT